jgi:hypothetical protein
VAIAGLLLGVASFQLGCNRVDNRLFVGPPNSSFVRHNSCRSCGRAVVVCTFLKNWKNLEPLNCRALLEPLSCRSGKLMVQVTNM